MYVRAHALACACVNVYMDMCMCRLTHAPSAFGKMQSLVDRAQGQVQSLYMHSPQPVWFALAVEFAPHMLQAAAPGPL